MEDAVATTLHQFRDSLTGLSKTLQLNEDFFEALLKEDDWSFVIKLHAIFEAALVQSLVAHLGEESLTAPLSVLDTGEPRYGKLVFARKLEVLGSAEVKFVKTLSELRNELVHKVHNVYFTFEKYIECLDSNQKNKFASAFTLQQQPDKETKDWAELKVYVFQDAKRTIWFIGITILVSMFIDSKLKATEKALQFWSAKTFELQQTQKTPATLSDLFSSAGIDVSVDAKIKN